MHIVALIGTRAQAIKMAPVVGAIRDSGLPCELVLSGQHEATVDELLADFELGADTRIWTAGEVKTVPAGLAWSPRVLIRALRLFRQRSRDADTVVLVHGDTVTTLIGAIAGRLARCRVGHVEAGLRSGSLTDPFPEELIRRVVTRLAHVAYCPGASYVGNATGGRRRCVDTGENTVLDAVRWAMTRASSGPSTDAGAPYVILSAHRLETVMVASRLRALRDLAVTLGEDIRVYFVLHPVTRARLERHGLLAALEQARGVELIPRMGYLEFIRLASEARAVLTDGGGNQEEMSYLGVPTLLLRRRTERAHGLGSTAHVTGLDAPTVRARLAEVEPPPRRCHRLAAFTALEPAGVIAADLAAGPVAAGSATRQANGPNRAKP